MKIKHVCATFLALVLMVVTALAQVSQDSVDAHRAAVEQYRAAKDALFSNSSTTPLPASQQPQFAGLAYYPVDYAYKLTATYIPDSNPRRVPLNLSDGGTKRFVKSGQVTFKQNGVEYTVSVYQNDNLPEFSANPAQLFIPFKDATNGEQTFVNGRYLAITPPQQGGTFTFDLNMAANPYGEYNSSLPSVLPPPENILTAPLPTGERKYDDR
jgi:hypothetical protein